MGRYLNPSNAKFRQATSSEIYVDKTALLKYTNRVLQTEQKYVCVSRPRRFGKSMAANMLAAYYSRGCNSRVLFHGLDIERDAGFLDHLNRYNVIFWNMTEFISFSDNSHDFLQRILCSTVDELCALEVADDAAHEDVGVAGLLRELNRVYEAAGEPFIFIIDEWDCVFRERKDDEEFQRDYLEFLRGILKDQEFVGLVYMTGILPVKKYGTHSALNMFDEFSMLDPGGLEEFAGFTQSEVKTLCGTYGMDLDEMKSWYDGYIFSDAESVYSPQSVVNALLRRRFNTYWNQTESFEALKIYLDLNFDGLRDAVIRMLSGERVGINPGNFSNDMTTLANLDDVFTLMVHLGYLTYDADRRAVAIPNREIGMEFETAVERSGWEVVSTALRNSYSLLEAVWRFDEEAVADGVGAAHLETSHLQYNDENALSYTISLAFFVARDYYTVVREMPSGKGFADMVFLPRRKHLDKPALVVELKWDRSAKSAIRQIMEKKYAGALAGFEGDILLVGVSYDRKSREHECVIERIDRGERRLVR